MSATNAVVRPFFLYFFGYGSKSSEMPGSLLVCAGITVYALISVLIIKVSGIATDSMVVFAAAAPLAILPMSTAMTALLTRKNLILTMTTNRGMSCVTALSFFVFAAFLFDAPTLSLVPLASAPAIYVVLGNLRLVRR